MKALLIVDLQNDFLPGGALPAPQGDMIIPKVNTLMEKYSLVIASRDWHPKETNHFEKWPPHCIKETWGADFPSTMNTKGIDLELKKGTEGKDDGYSAFEATNIDLNEYLKENTINELVICGLTTEYCVKQSALDAVRNGYKVSVVSNAIAGVNANPGDVENALDELKKAGVHMTDTTQLL